MKRTKYQRQHRQRKWKLKIKPQTWNSLGMVVFLAASILIVLSFTRQGVVLGRLFGWLGEYVGWGVIFLPFIFLSCALMLSGLRWRLAHPNILLGTLLTAVSVTVITRSGRGGQSLWLKLGEAGTPAGAVVVLLAVMAIGLLLFFNTSIEELVDFIEKIKKVISQKKKPLVKLKTDFAAIQNRPLKINVPSLGEAGGVKRSEEEMKRVTGVGLLGETVVSNAPAGDQAWRYPPMSLLMEAVSGKADRGDINENAEKIEKTLESFGVSAKVVEVNPGPAVTQYALEIALGTKLSKITTLANDLALAMAAPTGQIRIEAPIPGRSLVGVEVPNRSPEFVALKRILTSSAMKKHKSKLAVALGLNVAGEPIIGDIGKMPHILIAGSTGSGKSVCLHSFISSILFRASPSEVKFLMVDPKRVELTQYNEIPHLLSPVIVEPSKVLSALKWAIAEMERRYKLFVEGGARNIEVYNEACGFVALPYILIVIDELADVMLFAPGEVEDAICRIAQMARATGIHLVVSTQRPSVDVITGLIKANIPCRIAFNVSSQIDSRVIIDGPGAEKLLGRGDMLYVPPDQAKATRIQGTYISDPEVKGLIEFLRESGKPAYAEEVTSMPAAVEGSAWRKGSGVVAGEAESDDLFVEAVQEVCRYQRASASLLQRRLSIGYARAARIIDQLEVEGVVGPPDSSKAREVLVKNAEEFLTGRIT
ncbi:MAG: DNA translocase FtsK [Candidatus Shapirobacteria bacterium]